MVDDEEPKECWKAIPGYDEAYEVSDFGVVRDIKNHEILDEGTNCEGYSIVSLRRQPHQINHLSEEWNLYRVDALVLTTFIGPTPLSFGIEKRIQPNYH